MPDWSQGQTEAGPLPLVESDHKPYRKKVMKVQVTNTASLLRMINMGEITVLLGLVTWYGQDKRCLLFRCQECKMKITLSFK